jgi:hypothetical protein
MANPVQTQRSVPQVLSDIVGNVEMIFRSEFRLAKTELKEEVSKVVKPAGTLGVGIAFGFYGFGALLLATVYGLSSIIPTWMAALLVGTTLSVVSAALVSISSKKLIYMHATPNKTIQSMEEIPNGRKIRSDREANPGYQKQP